MTRGLAEHLTATRGLAPDTAAAAVDAFVDDVYAQCLDRGAAVYPGLGTFRLAPSGLAFAADPALALVVNHRFAGIDAVAAQASQPAVRLPSFTPLAPTPAPPSSTAIRPVPVVGSPLEVAALSPAEAPASAPSPLPVPPPPPPAWATPEAPDARVGGRPDLRADARRVDGGKTSRRGAVPLALLATALLIGLLAFYGWWTMRRTASAPLARTEATRLEPALSDPIAASNMPDSSATSPGPADAASPGAAPTSSSPGAPGAAPPAPVAAVPATPDPAPPPTTGLPTSPGAAPSRSPSSPPPSVASSSAASPSDATSPRISRPRSSAPTPLRTRPTALRRSTSPADAASPTMPATEATPRLTPRPALRGRADGGAALATPITDRDALLGEVPLNPDAGGYTLVAGGAASAPDAESLAAPLRAAGFRVGVVSGTTADGRAIYRVCVGQFASQRQALAALARLRGAALPSDAWMLALPG